LPWMLRSDEAGGLKRALQNEETASITTGFRRFLFF